jgi:hypothetical protein
MTTFTALKSGFSTVELNGSDVENTKRVWSLVQPGVFDECVRDQTSVPQSVWCDSDREINPANGSFAQAIREAVGDQSPIFEMNGVYYAYNEKVAAFYNPPTLIRK